MIPEMIEHHKPECKQHDISANLLHNLVIYELLTLNRNKVLPNTGFFSYSIKQFYFKKCLRSISRSLKNIRLHNPQLYYPTITYPKIPHFTLPGNLGHIYIIAKTSEMFQYSFSRSIKKKAHSVIISLFALFFMWAQLGSNQRPPDYESGAANHLSYGPR